MSDDDNVATRQLVRSYILLFFSSFFQYGKLGHSNESGQATPKRVEGLVGLTVSQVACGVSVIM